MLEEAAAAGGGGDLNSHYMHGDIESCESVLCTSRERRFRRVPVVHSCTVHVSGGILSQGIMGPPPFA